MQAGQEAFGLLLDTGRSWHGQQHSSQFLSCHLILLLTPRTDKKFFSTFTIKVKHEFDFSVHLQLPPLVQVLPSTPF